MRVRPGTGQEVVPSKSGLLTTGFYALEKGNSFYALYQQDPQPATGGRPEAHVV